MSPASWTQLASRLRRRGDHGKGENDDGGDDKDDDGCNDDEFGDDWPGTTLTNKKN